MNEAGETTSSAFAHVTSCSRSCSRRYKLTNVLHVYRHLMGFFYRTIRMVENGIKPAYVFDGKPPQMKSGVLAKRLERRTEAQAEGEEAKEVGNAEDLDKLTRRTVKVTREHNEECRRLLTLMGIPWVVAPSEAEAQCAELCRGGLVSHFEYHDPHSRQIV